MTTLCGKGNTRGSHSSSCINSSINSRKNSSIKTSCLSYSNNSSIEKMYCIDNNSSINISIITSSTELIYYVDSSNINATATTASLKAAASSTGTAATSKHSTTLTAGVNHDAPPKTMSHQKQQKESGDIHIGIGKWVKIQLGQLYLILSLKEQWACF